MRLLLDSHLLIWLVAASERLPSSVREMVRDHDNQLFFSAASIWELSIKVSTGRSSLELPPAVLHHELIAIDFEEVPITAVHGLKVSSLPPIHKDPFDRILIAQAMMEDMVLLTSDEMVGRYGGPTRLHI